MKVHEKELVQEILFNWTLSKVRSGSATHVYRQDLVRTLSRLCVSQYHAEEIFKLIMVETDVMVLTSIASALFLHFRLSTKAPRYVKDMLLHRSLDHQLCGVELVYSLVRRYHLSKTFLSCLDKLIADILCAHPRDENVVHLVTRYFLERGAMTSVRLDVSILLPAEGLAWSSAIEYALSERQDSVLTTDMLAPLQSQYQLCHLVSLLPKKTQTAFLECVLLKKVRGETLLTLFRVIIELDRCDQVTKARIVPFVLRSLDELDHHTSGECRFLIWDVAWDILDYISTPGLVDFLDRVWQLVGRLPEFTLSWSKGTIKRILTRIYRDFPDSFVELDMTGTCTVEVLPDKFIEDRMDVLVHSLACGVHHHPVECVALARIKLVCRMNHYQLKRHRAFVEKHLQVLIRGMGDPDVMIRTAFRNVLPEIPDIYFDALVNFLESIVDTGDDAGMMVLTKCSSGRLRVLRNTIYHRVFTLADIGENFFIASPALLMLVRLPDDVLVPIVDRLVFDKTESVLRKLFILKHLPGHLLAAKNYMEVLAVHLGDDRPRVRDFFLDVLLRSKRTDVCTMMADKCVKMLIHTTRKSLQHKLIEILHLVDGDVLSDLLRCSSVSPRHLCILIRYFDEDSLSAFSDSILDICERHVHMDLAVDLLGRLSIPILWMHRERVLDLLHRRLNYDLPIDGTLHVAQFYANAGVEIAKEMLHEVKFREAMYM